MALTSEFSLDLLSQTIGYQNGGALNRYARVFVSNINKIPLGSMSRTDLLEAFHAEYGIYLNWDSFAQSINSIQDPYYRELLLVPVLRRLSPNQALRTKQNGQWTAFKDEDIAPLAARLQIDAALPVNEVEQHLHVFPYDYDKAAADLKKHLEEAALNNPTAPNFTSAFRIYELENNKQQNTIERTTEGLKALVANSMAPLADLTGGDKSPIVLLIQLMFKILGPIMAMIPAAERVARSFAQGSKELGSPLDEDDIERDPKFVEQTGEFAELNERLANQGRRGALAAKQLNEEWRRYPNSPEVWTKLLINMSKNGLLEEGDQWLKDKEKQLLDELREREEKVAEVEGVAETELRQYLQEFRAQLENLEDPALEGASERYSQQNFETRLKMFQQFSKFGPVLDKHNQCDSAREKAERCRIQAEKVENSLIQARAGHASEQVTRSLEERLLAVQAQWHQYEDETREIETHLGGEKHALIVQVAPAITQLYYAHNEKLVAAREEARQSREADNALQARLDALGR